MLRIWWRNKREKDLEEEVRTHLEMAGQERLERGESKEGAEQAVRREFGNVELVKETMRDGRGREWLHRTWLDVRYGTRALLRNPGFCIVAVLTLALGIGANTAIFSLINDTLFRSIPVRDADRLMLLEWQSHKTPKYKSYSSYGDCPSNLEKTSLGGCSFSEPFFRDLQKQNGAFASVMAFASANRLDLSGNGPASTVENAEYISGDYFGTLGIKPALGRLIGPEDDTTTGSSIVVLSYRYWRSQFGGSPAIVRKTILLNRIPCTVVGVAEERFDSLSPGTPLNLWVPLALQPRMEQPWDNRDADAGNWRLVLVGRLKQESTREQAKAQTNTLFQNALMYGEKPMAKPEDGATIVVSPIQQGLVGSQSEDAAPFYTMMVVVGIVLLVACANIAGLMLARATSRQKEMAVRIALGASRGRILRQLLTESLVLSTAGGVLGILFASWCTSAIVAFVEANLTTSLPFTPRIDIRVLLFTLAVSILTGILSGLAPALRCTRVNLTPSLKQGSENISQAGKRRTIAGNGLVVGQVALSVVVLLVAGLLIRSLQNLKNIDPGFDSKNVLTFSLDPTLIGYKTADTDNFYRDLRSRLAATAGVMSVSYSWKPLMHGDLLTNSFHLAGRPKDEQIDSDMMPVGPEFFATMRIKVLAGRDFMPADFSRAQLIATVQIARMAEAAAKLKSGAKSAAKVIPEGETPPIPAIVNQTFVKKYFSAVNPIGQIFGTQTADPKTGSPKKSGWEIIGVVADAKYDKLRRNVDATTYVPSSGGTVSFAVRTETDPMKFVPQIRAIVNQMDGNLPVFEVKTESQLIAGQIFEERLTATLSGFFGGLALLLACIGLYGLVSYEVAQRTREIGIRAALGAERHDVLRLVLSQGIRLTLVGAVVGIVMALGLTRLAADLFYGVKTTDPATYTTVTALLVGVTLVACYVPAWRATRIDPLVALRNE